MGKSHNAFDIADRGQAIETALRHAKPGDMVIIAGLGHQNYRNMNGVDIEWNDIIETKKLLRQLEQER